MSNLVPVPMSQEDLVETLTDILDRVKMGDSYEGSIEYMLPWHTALGDPKNDPPDVAYRVRGAYRLGNTQGQGGMRLIGRVGV